MKQIAIKETNPTLASLIDKVNDTHQATMITMDNHKKAILVSVEQWDSIQETLYLISIPGVKDDLIEGKNTEWENCTPIEDVVW